MKLFSYTAHRAGTPAWTLKELATALNIPKRQLAVALQHSSAPKPTSSGKVAHVGTRINRYCPIAVKAWYAEYAKNDPAAKRRAYHAEYNKNMRLA